jgi:hypothetical protein
MAPRPYRPVAELEGALRRGDLSYAVTLAAEVGEERRRPIDLDTALRFLPLVAVQQPAQYDAWALRWLARWIEEASQPTIERAATLAGLLADLPLEPSSFGAIREEAAGKKPATR